MIARLIPFDGKLARKVVMISDLLDRARSTARSSWTDLPSGAGVYVVYVDNPKLLAFSDGAGEAWHVTTAPVDLLQRKHQGIQGANPTDIVYIGKSVNIRKRVRQLARFGAGRAANHVGGEWIWQIDEIHRARLLAQGCPPGQEKAFEKWLLESFMEDHGDWPLGNREGGSGVDTWHP